VAPELPSGRTPAVGGDDVLLDEELAPQRFPASHAVRTFLVDLDEHFRQ
jgi:hypothetical protein